MELCWVEPRRPGHRGLHVSMVEELWRPPLSVSLKVSYFSYPVPIDMSNGNYAAKTPRNASEKHLPGSTLCVLSVCFIPDLLVDIHLLGSQGLSACCSPGIHWCCLHAKRWMFESVLDFKWDGGRGNTVVGVRAKKVRRDGGAQWWKWVVAWQWGNGAMGRKAIL